MYFLNKQNTDRAWIIVNTLSPKIREEPSPHIITVKYCIIIFITEANNHNPIHIPPPVSQSIDYFFYSVIIFTMEPANNISKQSICHILCKQHIIFYLSTKDNIDRWYNKISYNQNCCKYTNLPIAGMIHKPFQRDED